MHTPWSSKQTKGLGVTIHAANGEHIATVYSPTKARLIAAAPDLLAALRQVADYWAGGDVPEDIDRAMRAAIAKAEQ